MSTYTNTWFEDHAKPIWDSRLRLASTKCIFDYAPTTYLELGVCEGASMRWVMDNLPSVQHAVGIDQWQAPKRSKREAFKTYRDNALCNLSEECASHRVTIVQGDTAAVLGSALNDEIPGIIQTDLFDFAYVDASHIAWNALLDMQLVWRMLRVGGIMIIDDMNRVYNRGRAETRIAVWAFQMAYTNCFKQAFDIGRQIAFRKVG